MKPPNGSVKLNSKQSEPDERRRAWSLSECRALMEAIPEDRRVCYLKEIYDRVEGKPVETVKSDVSVKSVTFRVPPPRVLGESEDEYRARIDVENLARDHQRMIEGRPDEGV